jgi:phosphatidylinositol glycan class B
MEYLSLFPQFRAMILVLLPNLVQAYFAATADYYTWQLAEKIYGTGSSASWSAVRFPFQSNEN